MRARNETGFLDGLTRRLLHRPRNGYTAGAEGGPDHDVRYNHRMSNEYTAVVRQDGPWWIGWIEEIPGINCQAESREELMANLQSALGEMLDLNREEARKAAGDDFEEVPVSL
jgi:predicted RNase H-like HicB family nuclease